VSGHAYFYNFYGYLIILVLLIFEKNGQQWAYNRFGCDKVTEDRFRLMESELARLRETRNKSPNLNETIQEDENESRSSEGLAKPTQPVEEKPDELRKELKKWIMKKYRIKALNGIKILLEDTI